MPAAAAEIDELQKQWNKIRRWQQRRWRAAGTLAASGNYGDSPQPRPIGVVLTLNVIAHPGSRSLSSSRRLAAQAATAPSSVAFSITQIGRKSGDARGADSPDQPNVSRRVCARRSGCADWLIVSQEVVCISCPFLVWRRTSMCRDIAKPLAAHIIIHLLRDTLWSTKSLFILSPPL